MTHIDEKLPFLDASPDVEALDDAVDLFDEALSGLEDEEAFRQGIVDYELTVVEDRMDALKAQGELSKDEIARQLYPLYMQVRSKLWMKYGIEVPPMAPPPPDNAWKDIGGS